MINSNATGSTETYNVLRNNLGSLFDTLDDSTLENLMNSFGDLFDESFDRGQENASMT